MLDSSGTENNSYWSRIENERVPQKMIITNMIRIWMNILVKHCAIDHFLSKERREFVSKILSNITVFLKKNNICP